MQEEQNMEAVKKLSEVGSAESLEYLREQFKKKAVNQALSRAAFMEVLQGCTEHEDPTSDALQLHVIFDAFDRDHSGSIDVDEFNTGIRILFRGGEEERLRFAFSGLDYNHDGDVSPEEFLDYFKHYFTAKCALDGHKLEAARWKSIQQHLLRVFNASDTNHSGSIDMAEFRKVVMENPDHPFAMIWDSFSKAPKPAGSTPQR
eukprot:NODE_2988_length_1073_cov_32.041992_g2742_i0.p1 GENE.NODE_2988_length_1073_cov_32.041992_g2742_i0~~NODE_2988_length_1073_cov_32.041992_g2742_i0.p1  ORF type:complete len:203 (-),score=44.71 NODE_2988_length_1073_cov_32.041992_g2742_i0:253-861(-)